MYPHEISLGDHPWLGCASLTLDQTELCLTLVLCSMFMLALTLTLYLGLCIHGNSVTRGQFCISIRLSLELSKLEDYFSSLVPMDIQPLSVVGHFISEDDRLIESVVDVAHYFQFKYQCIYDDFLCAWCLFVYDDRAFYVLHNVIVLNNLPIEAVHC